MPDKLKSLGKSREALRHKLESLRAISNRQLAALVETQFKMREIDREMAMLDRDMNSIVDTSLNRLDQYHRTATHED
jgi:hypothetical protein